MITIDEIQRAAARIRPHLEETPLRPSPYFSEKSGFDVYLKLENWQPTGSFKVRGAINLVGSLSPEERLQGLVAWSAGNHGLGVAMAARIFDAPATIFIPKSTPQSKIEKFQYFPVRLIFCETYEDCEAEGRVFSEKEGAHIVHPYDDWRTIAGQGTIGLEIEEAMPEIDAIVVPVGGGGMISGISIAVRSIDPEVRIIAVQSAASPSLSTSLQDHYCYESFPTGNSIAEGIAGGIGKIVFQLAGQYIDEIINVSEERIQETITALVSHEQMIVEASAAAALAAIDQIESVPQGSRVAAVLSGANLDVRLLQKILATFLK